MKNDTPITSQIAEEILGKDASFPEVARTSVFCAVCFSKTSKSVAMRINRYLLNDLGDIILEGSCATCGGPVARYIESGEDSKHFARAKKYLDKSNPMRKGAG